jgi:hypothetical protein
MNRPPTNADVARVRAEQYTSVCTPHFSRSGPRFLFRRGRTMRTYTRRKAKAICRHCHQEIPEGQLVHAPGDGFLYCTLGCIKHERALRIYRPQRELKALDHAIRQLQVA